MTSTLQDKLKQFGFPEPDKYESEATYQRVQWWSKGYGCGEFSIMYSINGYSVCGWDKELKTDADWQAVAGFIKFLKGNNEN